ncbi:hypothetical protein WOLCODRAFT_146737 [Wolfiporia cocos MD-104 SS10]|uniref:Uncharacterized protein n=1 Tax=Wolfiporia cocos (strain MD-104) TaxID=742152 RepID=A0A2H3JA68_WOLCO|nr:hypothetical protein WOLCODRAFT_146737 [Wolfiporia cocos MD-104 SS10]
MPGTHVRQSLDKEYVFPVCGVYHEARDRLICVATDNLLLLLRLEVLRDADAPGLSPDIAASPAQRRDALRVGSDHSNDEGALAGCLAAAVATTAHPNEIARQASAPGPGAQPGMHPARGDDLGARGWPKRRLALRVVSSTLTSPTASMSTTEPTSPPATTMNAHSPSPPVELRHITSNTNLATGPSRERRLSNRNSQHLRTHRLGSRSPSSIPSSPTSVHSSSSAIFERDIEPVTPASTSHSIAVDPHRIPRGKISEQLEFSVPSVLDSAAAVLTSDAQDDDYETISIVAPAVPDAGYRSGFTSPISRMSSRSPSPTGMSANRRSLLFSGSPLQSAGPAQGSPPSRPAAVHSSTAPLQPASTTPTSAYFSVTSTAEPSETGSDASSPTTATHHESTPHPAAPPQATITIATGLPPSPSPKTGAKRLSFLSYMDLLSSTPASTLPLASLTSSATALEPPPHLPSVIGLPQAQYAASSSAGSIHGSPASVLERDAVLDDVGGEWEREGLGRGLEERLEALNAVSAASPVAGRA